MEVRGFSQYFREKRRLNWDAKSIIVAVSLAAEALAVVLFTVGYFMKA